MLHIDFETRSTVDLKSCGLAVYAADPTTSLWCMAYAFDDEPVQIWMRDTVLPSRIIDYVRSGGEVAAHNFAFEHAMWNGPGMRLHGFSCGLKITQGLCTQAMAYAMAIPASLANAAAATGLTQQKDMAGHRLMLQMCQPKEKFTDGRITWHDDSEKIRRLAEYCAQDLETERELAKRLLRLSPEERRVYTLDFVINNRGIAVDIESARRALEIVENEEERLNKKIRELTVGDVATTSAVGQLKQWLTWRGIKTEGVGKADVTEILKTETLPEDVKNTLLTRQEAAKSSTKKLRAIIQRTSEDGRARGNFQYHGAGTGRWAGRGIQLQNLPRGKFEKEEIDDIFSILSGDNPSFGLGILFGSPLSVISNALRSFFIAPPGKKLVWSDFSSIEARVLAWLSSEEQLLNVFRNGDDVYTYAYSRAFHVPQNEVTKAQRQIGKVMVLALGYQGGKVAFQTMGKGYGVNVDEKEAERIKQGWRETHPNIVNYWYNLERAAMAACQTTDVVRTKTPFPTRAVLFRKQGSFLFCKLPSGRVISYPYPKIQEIETPWGSKKDALTYMGEDPVSGKWERQKAYGGLLAENVTQAVARDLLVAALFRLEEAGRPVVAHVHDEIICELDDNQSFDTSLVTKVPAWAEGLPIAANSEEGQRYAK